MHLLKALSPGLLLFVVTISLLCSASTSEYYLNATRNLDNLRGEFKSLKRQSRFLTFKTLEDDLKIGLEFAVPFMNVPVKRAVDKSSSAVKSVANINIAALVLTAITVIAGVSAAAAFTNFGKMAAGKWKTERSSDLLDDFTSYSIGYRSTDGTKNEAPIRDIMSNVEGLFREYGIDITSCVQKTICVLVEDSTNNVLKGKGTSSNKIVDGLTSTSWLMNFISGTAVREAIDVGRSNYNCKFKYKSCIWSDQDIQDFIDAM